MKLGYFPGCSLHATAREYDESLRAVAAAIDQDLAEIDDWACCGATSAHATNHLLSVALPARTLALAEEQGMTDVLAPCAACYSRLATAAHEIQGDPALHERVRGVLERPFGNTVRVVSILQFLAGLTDALPNRRTRPLTGLRVACYYGCLLVRPPDVVQFDDPEQPSSMEKVVTALGATPVAWNRRLDCCGAGLSLARTGSVLRLGRAILDDARQAGADVVAVGCPMCHNNLDFRQKAIARRSPEPFALPIVFLTQLVGLALGLDPQTLGLERHFVATGPLVERLAAAGGASAAASGQEVA